MPNEGWEDLFEALTPASIGHVNEVRQRLKYGEALHSELLTLLHKKGILTKEECLTLIKNAHNRSKR